MRVRGLRIIGATDGEATGKGIGGRCCTWPGVDGWLDRSRAIMVRSHFLGGEGVVLGIWVGREGNG